MQGRDRSLTQQWDDIREEEGKQDNEEMKKLLEWNQRLDNFQEPYNKN